MKKFLLIILLIFGLSLSSQTSVVFSAEISGVYMNNNDRLAYNMQDLTISKIKPPSVAGTFYSADKASLINQIQDFKKNSRNMYKISSRAVIVPHAGLVYSGRLAYEGISQLDKNIKNIFIFAPAHRVAIKGIGVTSYDIWQTTLGNIKINRQITNELVKNYGAKIADNALAPEHAIEVELPFVQTEFENVKIIPVLMGDVDSDKIYEIIAHYYKDKDNGFIISSDLSHYLSDANAKRIDNYTAQHIENCDSSQFTHELACGATGILGLMKFAKENNYSLIRIDMTNSASTTFDKSRVVGYGTWFLYEGERNEFLKNNYSKFIIDLCKTAIKTKNIDTSKIIYPQVFSEYGAVFVTLEKNCNLRGCIGSILPQRPVIQDIMMNAKNSAYSDPRFNPVDKKEIKDLKISVSLLSIPAPMKFKNEEDLLNQIRVGVDGIIIRDGSYQAVYLPSVWEQLPDKKQFLNSLKVKAGMSPNHFSKTFEAYRFTTSYIKEDSLD